MSLLEVRLLGPLEAGVEGRRIELRRRKQRELLAILALRAGEVVSTDRLVDELWGETPPKAAVGSLQNLVSELRKVLPPDVLVTRAPGYALDIERDAVDAHRFERLAREARDADPQQRVTHLREALALWRGPALADIQLEQTSADEAARLEELRVAAWEDRLEAELELGRHSQAIGELESFVSKHPLRERPVGLLMLALYRAGRQSHALETYRRARETLVDELGIDPSPELQRLEQAILRHDPELDLSDAPRQRVPPAEPDRRKTVTILFADLVGSTELGDRLDPEVLRRVLDRYFELVRSAVERHGGMVEKFIGDAAMAVFGIPTLHEDDALRAVRAASELRESLAALSSELAVEQGTELLVSVGVNTGEVFVRDSGSGESFATGAPVNAAMRLEQAAKPGEVLLGEPTYALTRHAVDAEPAHPIGVGGTLERAAAFRLLAVGEDVRPLGTARLVGRRDELAWLQAAFAGANAERSSRVVVILGDPGVGKTRLTSEFVSSLGTGARALFGRCVSYGDGATYLPLDEVVRQAAPERPRAAIVELLAGDEQAQLVAERVTQLSGSAGGAASTGEVFWAVRRFLEALALEQPLVVVLEDVHWAEPTLLDLIDYLDSWTARAPLMVVCLARRELLEQRPGWSGRDRVLALEPLSAEEAATLVAELRGEAIDRATLARIVEIAEGNALFLEQLLAFAEEAGADALGSLPPSVEVLLADRLDRVELEERALLERAAVVGREFSRASLLQLSPPAELAALDTRLRSLVRRGLIRPARARDGDLFRFHHVLIRDVAYAGITKEARAQLHERFGTWLEQRAESADEIVGYHLEQAHRYRRELHPGDPTVAELARRGGRVLATAGVDAWKQADAPASVNLLGRAAALLPTGEPGRGEILCELGIALVQHGDSPSGETAFAQAIDEAAVARDEATGLYAKIELARSRLHRGGDPDQLVALVRGATPLFESTGNDRALGRAWRALGYARGSMQGRCVDWLDAAERALPYLRGSGWSTAGCLSEIAAALYYGPTPVPEAQERCEQLLDEATDRLATAHVLVFLAGLQGYDERVDDALRLLDEADVIYRQVADEHGLANTSGRLRGRVCAVAGDHTAAEAAFRSCCATFDRVGDAAALSTVAAKLGASFYATGRIDDARQWSGVAECHAPAGDVIAQFSWRSLKAKLLAHDGELAGGERLAQEALALVMKTDALTHQGDVLLDVAAVLTAANRRDEAAGRVREAIDLYERKQNAASARNARARFAGAEVV